ncbi:MAG: hypothetical protein JSW51_00145 [Gemmatimonadota bacterium]|nr:MAG: hypothetical protein JSW51_00145 [Gemmatimonadota bacterium]
MPAIPLHYALVSLALVTSACGAGGARPRFDPFPQAISDTMPLLPDSAIIQIGALLAAEGIEIQHLRPREGYVESKWFDIAAGRTVGASSLDTESVVRFRFWSDPATPGNSVVTGEAVRRRVIDPSQPERETEQPVPADHPAAELLQRMLAALNAGPQG